MALAPNFTMPGPTLRDMTSADFLAGTVGAAGAVCAPGDLNCVANAYVAENADGEVTLAPVVGAEFSGSSLPPGWIGSLWQPSVGGSFSVDGGTRPFNRR